MTTPLGRLTFGEDIKRIRHALGAVPPSGSGVDHGSLAGLGDDDHTQYLKADGTRQLTGNLSVAAGITIDGVDLSAHVATADAHHDPVTAGGGIALSGQQVSVDEPNVDHDALGGFVANEHIDHSAITLTAGAGLIGGGNLTASRTISVAAGDGIDVAADSVAVDVTDIIDTAAGLTETSNNIQVYLGAGLAFSTGAIVLAWSGTPSTVLPDAVAAGGSSSYAARVDHTHAIAAAAPGANSVALSASTEGVATSFARSDHTHQLSQSITPTWTGLHKWQNASLQSDHYVADTAGWRIAYDGTAEFVTSIETAAGTFHGAVSVDDPHNVTFGSSFIYDGSQGAVGIGGNPGLATWPDPQFKLDVNGSLRAWGYIVGKHALQIPDARHIWHFDGPLSAGDFTGVLQSHRGLTPQLISGELPAVGFIPGKFGKSVIRAVSSTNHVTNPSFETGVTDWSGAGENVVSQSSDQAKFGSYSMNVAYQNHGILAFSGITTLSAGVATVSAYIYVPSDFDNVDSIYIWLGNFTGSSGSIGKAWTRGVDPAGEWVYVWSRTTIDAGDTSGHVQFRYSGTAPTAGRSIYVDGVKAERLGYLTPYFDGSMPDCSWSGTAHASSSTRSFQATEYSPADLFGTDLPVTYSLSLWAKAYAPEWTSSQYVFMSSNATPEYLYIRTYNGSWHARHNDVSIFEPATALEWTHLALVVSGGSATFYVNGEVAGSGTGSDWSQALSGAWIGSFGVNQPFNGLIDDFMVVERALDADEVRAIYESNAPVFAETSTFSWHDPTLSIRVDDQGLFARSNDDAADAIFAIATQDVSWGGHSLGTGDVLMGNSTSVLWWDYSAGDMTLGDPAAEHILFDGSNLHFYNGVTRMGYLSGDIWRIGKDSGAPRIDMTSGSVGVYDATGTERLNLASGSIRVGKSGSARTEITDSGITLYDGDGLARLTATTSLTVGRSGEARIAISDTEITIYDGAATPVDRLSITAGTIRVGRAGDAGVEIHDLGLNVYDPSGADRLALGSGSVRIGQSTGSRIQLSDTAITIYDGAGTPVDRLSITAGTIRVGKATDARTEITDSGIDFYDASSTQVGAILGGSFWFGDSFTSERLTWDGANGLRIMNASNAAVLQFPISGDAQIAGTLGVTGTVTAGGGSVTIDDEGIRIDPTTEATYTVDSAYKIGTSSEPDMTRWWLDEVGGANNTRYSRIELDSENNGHQAYIWLIADDAGKENVEIGDDLYVQDGFRADFVEVGSAAGAVSGDTGTLSFNTNYSTDPASTTVQLYRKSGELWVMDGAGNTTQLSPHDGAGDWVYHSRNTITGRRVRINMIEVVRAIERLTGEQLIEIVEETQ